MKSTKPKRKYVKKAKVLPYSASIKVLGRLYTSTGTTAREAIENIKIDGVAKGMSILEITKGEVKRSKILTPALTFRLFSASRMMREIALKNASLIFEGI